VRIAGKTIVIEAVASRVLYEDAELLAIDKPEGLSSIPERDVSVPSLQKLLEAARGERLFVVHRLDKEVSGAILFARTAAAHRAMSIAFEERRVSKTYLALAHGAVDDQLIDKPLAQFGSGRMGVRADGKPSQTRVVMRERFATTTLCEAHPITGRRHQLRVHFYAIGHALCGDPRYGDRDVAAKWPRLMLHALRITIEDRTIECAPSKSFQDVLLNSTLVPR
jgi:tRNA pseudouridine32 synthase / 23S rRNA pseudouridine746 synthase